jgi:hypothetical protein
VVEIEQLNRGYISTPDIKAGTAIGEEALHLSNIDIRCQLGIAYAEELKRGEFHTGRYSLWVL